MVDAVKELLAASVQKAGVVEYAADLLLAMGEKLTPQDQAWLHENLRGLPGYLRSHEGAALMREVVGRYRASLRTLTW